MRNKIVLCNCACLFFFRSEVAASCPAQMQTSQNTVAKKCNARSISTHHNGTPSPYLNRRYRYLISRRYCLKELVKGIRNNLYIGFVEVEVLPNDVDAERGVRQGWSWWKLRRTSMRKWKTESAAAWTEVEAIYHRRPIAWCCILAGDTECGGLDILKVAGLIIGIAAALRARVAAGWCNLRFVGWLCWYEGMYGFELELRENVSGATWWDCGECSGEPLDSDDRSDDEEWMETMSVSVRRVGQNSRSSSRSKERPASYRCRKLVTATASSSFRTLLNCLCEFCDRRGALRPRPLWCEEVAWAFAEVGCWWVL